MEVPDVTIDPEDPEEVDAKQGKLDVLIGDFRVKAVPKNFVLYKTIILGARARVPGSKKEVFAGFYSTFESALKAIPSKALLGSDATSLADAVRVVEGYRDMISDAMKGV